MAQDLPAASRGLAFRASLSGLTQLIVGRLETLSDRGRLGPGDFDSLVQTLETVLAALQRGDSPVARQGLEVFIGDVQGLSRRGTLSSAEADPLVSAANDLLAQL